MLKINRYSVGGFSLVFLLAFFSFNLYSLNPSFGAGASAGTAVSVVWTDYNSGLNNGVWKSDTDSSIPDTDHNLLAFTSGGVTYSTGVDDSKLSGVTYTTGSWRALPVEGLPNTSSSNYFVARAFNATNKPGFSNPASSSDLAQFLTDGTRGLNIGSGVTNIPSGQVLTFNLAGSISLTSLNDGVPDILITQIATASSTPDYLEFLDAANNRVGSRINIDQQASAALSRPVVGSLKAIYYDIPGATPATGFSFPAINELRLRSYELSEFGINASNFNQPVKLVWGAAGSSDPAFFAYNTESLSAVGGSKTIGSATTSLNSISDQMLSAGSVTAVATNSASLSVTYSSSTTSVCTVDSTCGVITFISVGTCSITASQVETEVSSTVYPASSASLSFLISNTITPSSGTPGTPAVAIPTESPTPEATQTLRARRTVTPSATPTTQTPEPTTTPQVETVTPSPTPGTRSNPATIIRRDLREVSTLLQPNVIALNPELQNEVYNLPETLNEPFRLIPVDDEKKFVTSLASAVVIDGVPDDSRVVVIEQTKAQVLSSDGGLLTLEARAGEKPVPVDSLGRIQMVRNNFVISEGKGLAPVSEFAVYLFSDPILLGVGITNAQGEFFVKFPVENDLPIGEHTLQVVGIAPGGAKRTVSLPVIVVENEESALSQSIGNVIEVAENPVEAWISSISYLAILFGILLILVFWALWWLIFKRRKKDEEEEIN